MACTGEAGISLISQGFVLQLTAVERVADQRRFIAAVRVWLSYARSVPLYRGLPVCEYSACHHLRASMAFQSIALPIQLCIFSHS